MIRQHATMVEVVPHVFEFPRDPDDAHYVDLALAVAAKLIVSRDKDLLCVDLGQFEVRLCWPGIALGRYSYSIIALNPSPAASNSEVTHPHVLSEKLCERDGHGAVRSALAAGRLLD